ncbi:hypothetical protein [Aeromicrobium stalagmiti]|uniref:hypothetical protein n=1 Tax=Aeromicrobium stalagmiti TaxID=2738988 RepID=UPI0015699EA2|nr:hypothetical protein [Aeromicrobium stalagmiti]NRQ48542.1 hypothetical protein [Aeromicrobium stalagmiti]
MSGEVRLGLRLAGGGRPRERMRMIGTGLAHAVGVWVLLVVIAAVRAEIALPDYDGDALPLLVVTVVATVGVPIIVLLATMARLSAVLRDRRLACLRVLGLSPGRTRVVASVEAGASAAIGSVLGALLFGATRPLLRGLDVAGRDWSSASFAPWWWAVVLVLLTLPSVAVAVALAPGARPASTLSTPPATAIAARPPSRWRLLPLPVGLVAVSLSTVGLESDADVGDLRLVVLVGGGIVTALGLIMVIPVFTRLVADLVVRVKGGPALRIAGRRLQSQPAGVSRVVAGLLIGLFVVSGGRMVLGAWESTPQYLAADSAARGGQVAYDVYVDPGSGATDLAERLASVQGVVAAYPQWQLMTACDIGTPCVSAFVGTCADLEASVPDAAGCRDGQAAWLDRVGTEAGARPGSSIRWTTGSEDPDRPVVDLAAPAADAVITSSESDYAASDAVQAQVFIPRGTAGVATLLDTIATDTAVPVAVEADTSLLDQAGLVRAVRAIDPSADVVNPWDDDSYDFVAGLRALLWAVAAVVLAIGLLGFAIATIDRTVSRRAEMVSLQLVGTGRRVIRVAQWWEAAVPLVLGLLLATSTGSAVGLAYLSLTGDIGFAPWRSITILAAVSSAAAVAVAGVTVAACAPRIRAELIRRA